MKKLPFLLLLLAVSAYGGDDSNTANVLPCGTVDAKGNATASCASFGTQLGNFLAKEDAVRQQEIGFNNMVSNFAQANSCLGAAGAGLTMTPTSCVAYNAGFRSTETGSITFSDNTTTWVAMDENTSGNNAGLPNFTRVAGTHYLTDAIDVTQPAASADSQILMKVVTAGGAVTVVTDLRTLSISIAPTTVFPATGNYSMNSHKLTSQAVGTTSGDGIVFGLNHLNDLAAATGNYALGSHKLTGLIAGTASGDSLAFALNDLSQLATATGNYSMGTNRLTSVAANTTLADALSQGQSHINDLTTATGPYNMGANKLTNLAVGTTSGDAMAFSLNHLNDLATATGNYAMGSNKITGLANAGATNDAVGFGQHTLLASLALGSTAKPTVLGNFLLDSAASVDPTCGGSGVGCITNLSNQMSFYADGGGVGSGFTFYAADQSTKLFLISRSAAGVLSPAGSSYGFYAGSLAASAYSTAAGNGGTFGASEGTAPAAGAANIDIIYADSTAHTWKTSLNNGSYVNLVRSGIMGSSNAVVSNSAANVFPAFGNGTAVATTSEGTVSSVAPWAATIRNLKCVLTTAAGVVTVAGGTNYVVALRQNLATSLLTCTITLGNSACTDNSDAIAVAIGDQLDFIDTPNGTPTALVVKCSAEVDF